jgi:Ca2+-binding EF-hand superfamily protein
MPRKSIVIQKRELDIPQDKIAEYQEAFNMFDINKDGLLTVDEIFKMMKNYGYPLPKTEIKKMMDKIDTDGDGQIDFEEFITLIQSQTIFIDETDDDAILRAFKSFDKDHDGKIPNSEFRFLLNNLGNIFSKEETEELFKISNLNDEGELDYVKFIEFWKEYRRTHH